VPLYYERDGQDLPRQWLRHAKQAIRTIAPRFSAQRMVIDYIDKLYVPASEGGVRVTVEPVGAVRS
jgi:starch phosphorylase